MSINVSFGPVTVAVGSRQFGPATASNTDTAVTLIIDRTVTNGLNSLTVSSVILAILEMSTDGVNWHAVDTNLNGSQTSWSTVGSAITFTDRQGVQHVYAESSGNWPLFPGTGRQLRATVIVSGPTPIAVAGSIVTS
jgi:hypothetical protein